jgi:hypothetical protein
MLNALVALKYAMLSLLIRLHSSQVSRSCRAGIAHREAGANE